jgi:SPP1 gp7 family putative phage head morphogenesis protein
MPEITPARIGLALQLPPEEALAFLFGKDSAVYASFKDVQPEVFRTVFTVAGVMKMDVLLAVRKLVEDALQNGESFAEFRKRMSENELIAAVLPISRLQTIYRTNLQSAFMAARYKQQMAIAERKPFWQFVGVMDDSTTRGCRQLDGKVFRYDDDFWKTNYPPRHFNCRSRVIALNQREIEQNGSVVEQGKNYQSIQPDSAFAATPDKPWKPDVSKYNKQEKALLQKHLASSGYSQAEEKLFLSEYKNQQ